jgi:hypothetical protein
MGDSIGKRPKIDSTFSMACWRHSIGLTRSMPLSEGVRIGWGLARSSHRSHSVIQKGSAITFSISPACSLWIEDSPDWFEELTEDLSEFQKPSSSHGFGLTTGRVEDRAVHPQRVITLVSAA